MVQYKDGDIYLKIVYYGMAGSGKTTILQTLYQLTKDGKRDIVPISDLQKINRTSGATLYFDRGVFQSTKKKKYIIESILLRVKNLFPNSDPKFLIKLMRKLMLSYLLLILKLNFLRIMLNSY